jgi:phage terminase Nu1 subunit (DNA packaging protein)
MKLNRKQLAENFGVAKTTIDNWKDQGCPVEGGGGKGVPVIFDTAKVFQWLIKKNPAQDDNFTLLLEQEKYRKLKRENDLEEKMGAPGELLPDGLEKIANIWIPILESLPLMIKRNWPEVTGDMIMLVKKAVAECRNAIDSVHINLD